MHPLQTSTAIRRALGDDYQALIDKYDRKATERRATARVGAGLRPQLCAVCGRLPPAVLRLEAAHITPLAECATTDLKNLALLCKENPGDVPGCHTLFDHGYCSINAI